MTLQPIEFADRWRHRPQQRARGGREAHPRLRRAARHLLAATKFIIRKGKTLSATPEFISFSRSIVHVGAGLAAHLQGEIIRTHASNSPSPPPPPHHPITLATSCCVLSLSIPGKNLLWPMA